MNLELERMDYEADGIFSVLYDEQGMFVAECLEHAYDSGHGDGSYLPKLPNGTYTCKRSMHRLHGMTHDFETFEVMNVPAHSGILFHVGNYSKDSEGCILLGQSVITAPSTLKMVTHSRETFAKFMEHLKGINEFTLTVK